MSYLFLSCTEKKGLKQGGLILSGDPFTKIADLNMDEVFVAIDTNLNVLGFSCIMPNGVSNQVDQHLPQLLFIKLNLSLIGNA